MFEHSLIESRHKRDGVSRLAFLPVAIASHCLVVAVLAVAQLWAVPAVPPPDEQSVLWIKPLPPPAGPRSTEAGRETRRGGPATPPAVIQPDRVPDSVPSPPVTAPAGSPASVPGGLGDPNGEQEGVDGGLNTGAPAPLPAPAERPAVLRVGGLVLPPIAISKEPPVYPETALIAHRQGPVTVEVVLDATGSVVELRLVEDRVGFGCGPAALAAIRHWRYRPATLRGEPVSVLLLVTVTFSLPGR